MFRSCALLLWFMIIVLVTDVTMSENSQTCVIGAGYSGLATARYLRQIGLNFTVLERCKEIGGTWRFDPNVGVDEDGVPVSTSQYKNLRTNSPRYTMEFTDFPFPNETKSFVSGTCFYKYIKSFVRHFDLMKNIQLRSYVTSVKRKENKWELSYYHTVSKKNYTLSCDFVVVATGQHNKPYSAKFPGLNNFKGKIIHSHDYKSPEIYKDRKVLIVGAGPSGLDIAVKLHKITNKLLHSHHLVYNEPKFSERYVKKPDIKEFVSNGAIFNDSSFEEVEDLILATGFRLEHPFLDESCGLFLCNRFVLPLHNQIVNIREPSMMFVGLSKQTINRILDVQAEYVSLLISGMFELPSREKMLERWVTKYSSRKLKDVNSAITELKPYVLNVTQESGATTVPPVLIDIVFKSGDNLKQDLFHYREYEFEIIDSETFRMYSYNDTSQVFPNITEAIGEECTIEDIDL